MKYIVKATLTASFEVDDTDYDEDDFPYRNNISKSIARIEQDNLSDDPYILLEQDDADITVTVEKKND